MVKNVKVDRLDSSDSSPEISSGSKSIVKMRERIRDKTSARHKELDISGEVY